jgi:hypothetical protein
MANFPAKAMTNTYGTMPAKGKVSVEKLWQTLIMAIAGFSYRSLGKPDH